MTLTVSARQPRRPRSSGVRLMPEFFEPYIAPPARPAFPAEVLDAIAALDTAKAKLNDAQSELWQAHESHDAAAQADAIALADAIAAGKADPGPKNANKARTDETEARRRVEALEIVLRRAHLDAHAAYAAMDRAAVAATIHAQVLDAAEQIRTLSEQLDDTYSTALELVSTLADLDAWPSGSVGRPAELDPQELSRATSEARDQAQVLASVRPYLLDPQAPDAA